MTRKSGWLAVVVGAAVLIGGCATMSTGAYVARRTDFARYRTFAWGEGYSRPIGDPRLDNNTIFRDYVQGAVERHLQSRGLVLVAPTADPDLLVHFHARVTQTLETTVDRTRGSADGSVPAANVDEGRLVVDMMEPKSDRLVFRGWAVDNVNGIIGSQDRMEMKIEEAVTRMLGNFPAS
jgi:hypothetical protein